MYSLQKHLQYNAWANEKAAAFLATVDETVLDTEMKSSFPSIRKTITHIWDAQQIWLTRLQGESLTKWPSESFNGTTKELLDAFVENSHALVKFIATKDQAYLNSNVVYKNLKGTEFSTTADEILFHVVNHGTFHRGQILTMLRELGFTTFESQDLITFLRM